MLTVNSYIVVTSDELASSCKRQYYQLAIIIGERNISMCAYIITQRSPFHFINQDSAGRTM